MGRSSSTFTEGHSVSPAVREKLRVAALGNTNRRGTHLSEETKQKLRIAMLGSKKQELRLWKNKNQWINHK